MKNEGDKLDRRLANAMVLHASGRLKEAKMEYVAILMENPDHQGALNQYADIQNETGHIKDAITVYHRLLEMNPRDPVPHVRLGNIFREMNNPTMARIHYESALSMDPDQANAHQGMAYIFSELHDAKATMEHGRKGYMGRAFYKLPYRGTAQPINVLVLYSVMGGNIPLDKTIDNTVFQHIPLTVEFHTPSSPLPPHSLVFNAIGDADQAEHALGLAVEILKSSKAPLLNPPERIFGTGRAENSRRLAGIQGLLTPKTVSFPSAVLQGEDAPALLESQGFRFPLLLRAQGFHTGKHFVKLDSPEGLAAAAKGMPGENLMVIQFVDTRGADGATRKYRAMMIDGRLYPLHVAISQNWKIHYFSADMTESAAHRAEDGAFLKDMPAVLGDKAMATLREIQSTLGLDYGGIDFGLTSSGEVLLYETNATMVLLQPGTDARWDYRREPVQKAFDAVNAMIKSRIKVRS